MELLIIRHAESQYNVGHTTRLNSQLTTNGYIQAMLTAEWLNVNFDGLEEFKPLTSPYFRTLQTAYCLYEATDLEPFHIEPHLREYHIKKDHDELKKGGICIPTEMFVFDQFHWPNMMLMGYYFKNETLDEFFARMKEFFDSLDKNGKYLFVSHGATCRTLHTLSIGEDLSDLKERYLRCDPSDKNSIKNASITWVKEGHTEWFSKVVY